MALRSCRRRAVRPLSRLLPDNMQRLALPHLAAPLPRADGARLDRRPAQRSACAADRWRLVGHQSVTLPAEEVLGGQLGRGRRLFAGCRLCAADRCRLCGSCRRRGLGPIAAGANTAHRADHCRALVRHPRVRAAFSGRRLTAQLRPQRAAGCVPRSDPRYGAAASAERPLPDARAC